MGWRRVLRAGLPLNVVALGATSFFGDLSTEMITPILPLFLVGVLAANYSLVGLIEGGADALLSLLRLASGWYSDKLGRRKPFLVIGYAPTAFLKPLLSLAQTPLHYLAIRLPERAGKGWRGAPRDALVADSVDKGSLGKAFGFRSAMDTAGAVVGSLVGLGLLSFLVGDVSSVYRTMFVISALPAGISVLIVLVFVKEKHSPDPEVEARSEPRSFLRGVKSFDPQLKLFLLAVGLFSLGNFNLAFFLLKAGEVGVGANLVVFLFVLFNIAYATLALPAGVLSDRVGRRGVILLGLGLFSLTSIVFLFSKGLPMLIGAFALYGGFMAVFEGVPKAYVAEIATPEYRATALGALATVTAIMTLPSSLIAGLLWDSLGSTATFTFSATLATITFTIFAIQTQTTRR